MYRFTAAFALLLAASSMVSARNAADLKADLAKIAPAGKKIRLAWIKGGPFTEFPFYAYSTVVYVVDSDDGIIRRLYPATGSGNYCNVNITADGSRVLVHNKDTGRLRVIDWNGSSSKEIDVGGEPIEYWHAADGTDWSIAYVNNMSRVNIDQPTQRVRIGAAGLAGNGGTGLSDDGTKLVGYCYEGCSGGPFGIITTATNQWTMSPHGGCWSSMSAGSAPKYNHNPSGHTQMCVHDAANQSSFKVYEIAKTIGDSLKKMSLSLPAGPTNGCGEWATTEGTRFTQHPDFATTMYSQSKVNPVLLHLPDMKFVWIEDGLSCGFCGDMDAVFLPSTGILPGAVATKRQSASSLAGSHQVANEAYSPNGRRIDATRGRVPSGIVIRRHGPGVVDLRTTLVY